MQLRIKPPMEIVDVDLVIRQPDLTGAIKLGQSLSGLEDKAFVGAGGVVPNVAAWSRIVGKSRQHHFPQDQLNNYMDRCRNEVPLIWLAYSRGYLLTPMETETERLLRIEREGRMAAEQKLAMALEIIAGRTR